MKKLTRDIKKMLAALALESAGEHMSSRHKFEYLNPGARTKKQHKPAQTASQETSLASTPEMHVAVLFDGEVSSSVIDYVLNTSHINNAHIDILSHGSCPSLSQKTKQLSLKFQQAGRKTRVSLLSANPSHLFINYRKNTPGLHLIIASDTDQLIHDVINSSEYRSHGHHVPLVLIQNSQPQTNPEFSDVRGQVS